MEQVTPTLILSATDGSTTGTSITLTVNQTVNRVITFPDSMGTLTTTQGREELTNKIATDSSNNITTRSLFSIRGC